MPTMTEDHDANPQLPGHDSTPTADRDWFGGRRWTGIAAVGVLVLIAVAAVVLVISRHHNGNSTASGGTTATSSAPVAPASTASSAPASSPTAQLPTTPPTSAPTGTTWSIYETVALPTIPGAGPSQVNGAIATGYARTPVGALLAVANEGFRYGLAPDTQWRTAAAAMLARGAGYDAWLKVRAAHPYGSAGAAGGDQLAQIAGFQFVSYTPSDAVIQIVTRDAQGSLQVASDHVIWRGADWKYVTASDGSQAANAQQISDMTGFIEWRGV